MKEIISNVAAILSIISFIMAIINKVELRSMIKKREIKHVPHNIGVY